MGGTCIQRWISCSSTKTQKKDGFQGEARTGRAVFRVSKTAQIKKKGFFCLFFKDNKKYQIKVCFLPIINTGLGYDFEPISLIRV